MQRVRCRDCGLGGHRDAQGVYHGDRDVEPCPKSSDDFHHWESDEWYDQPLRLGEYDVTVRFRVTAGSFVAAVDKVREIVDNDRFERHIVPIYVPDQEPANA